MLAILIALFILCEISPHIFMYEDEKHVIPVLVARIYL